MKGLLVLMVLCFALLEVNAKVVNREMIREEKLQGVLKALRDLQMLAREDKPIDDSDENDSDENDSDEKDSDENDSDENDSGSEEHSGEHPEEHPGDGNEKMREHAKKFSGPSEELLYYEMIAEFCGESGESKELGDEDDEEVEFDEYGFLEIFYDNICEVCELDEDTEELNEDDQEIYDHFCGGGNDFCDEFDPDVVEEELCGEERMYKKRVQEQKMKRAEKFAKIFERHIKYLKKTSA